MCLFDILITFIILEHIKIKSLPFSLSKIHRLGKNFNSSLIGSWLELTLFKIGQNLKTHVQFSNLGFDQKKKISNLGWLWMKKVVIGL